MTSELKILSREELYELVWSEPIMRLAKQYAISSDTVPCRVDVLFGFDSLYQELANRHVYETDLL